MQTVTTFDNPVIFERTLSTTTIALFALFAIPFTMFFVCSACSALCALLFPIVCALCSIICALFAVAFFVAKIALFFVAVYALLRFAYPYIVG